MTTNLLAALETATVGSRELDAKIALIDGWRQVEVSREDPFGNPTDWSGLPPDEDRPRAWAPVPPYTTSLDEALALAPAWTRERLGAVSIISTLGRAAASFRSSSLLDPACHEVQGYAQTAPLAVCLAGLRARQSHPAAIEGPGHG